MDYTTFITGAICGFTLATLFYLIRRALRRSRRNKLIHSQDRDIFSHYYNSDKKDTSRHSTL